jgi:hypothetical protein
MELHEIEIIEAPVLFRKMRVESGFLYNFYDYGKNVFSQNWVFVPDVSNQTVINAAQKDERIERLEQFRY